MQSHTLKRNTPNKKKRQVGRGGTRGKTSGRGTKGQNARAGRKKRPQMRDIIKKIPKLRGYKFNGLYKKRAVVSLSDLNIFEDGAAVNPKILFEKGMVRKVSGKLPVVKILGNGEISKKISVSDCEISKSASEKIQKAGGSVK